MKRRQMLLPVKGLLWGADGGRLHRLPTIKTDCNPSCGPLFNFWFGKLEGILWFLFVWMQENNSEWRWQSSIQFTEFIICTQIDTHTVSLPPPLRTHTHSSAFKQRFFISSRRHHGNVHCPTLASACFQHFLQSPRCFQPKASLTATHRARRTGRRLVANYSNKPPSARIQEETLATAGSQSWKPGLFLSKTINVYFSHWLDLVKTTPTQMTIKYSQSMGLGPRSTTVEGVRGRGLGTDPGLHWHAGNHCRS